MFSEACPSYSPFFAAMGCAISIVFCCFGAAYGTAKSGVGLCVMGVMRPELMLKNAIPIVMAGIVGIYGVIISVVLSGGLQQEMTLYASFISLASGLSVGLAGLGAGFAIGVVGDAGVRGSAQQPKLFVGMILILIFAEVLGLYGMIVALILQTKASTGSVFTFLILVLRRIAINQLKNLKMSNLRKQLENLSSTTKPKQTSLLFERKVAGGVDRETIFKISTQALKEFCVLDERFEEYKNTLYSEQVKAQDRTLLTVEENATFDKSIGNFLRLVSPHFLHSSCFKLLEWLVRRFQIHEFNIDQVMECILPYHETPQFIRFVEILAITLKSRWAFLAVVQKSKAPLTRSIIVGVCAKDNSLLDFIMKMYPQSKALEITNYTLVSFFTYTLIEYFTVLEKIKDNHIRQTLPIILEGLESSDDDYRSGMQMLVALISKKIVFQDVLLHSIFESLSKGAEDDSLYTALLVLVTIGQSQKITTFPETSMERMLLQQNFLVEFLKVVQNFSTENCVVALAKCLTSLACNGSIPAKECLESLLLAPQVSQRSLNEIVKFIVQNLGPIEQMNAHVIDILKAVQNQRFKQVDASINAYLDSFEGSKQSKKGLYAKISQIFAGSTTETLAGTNTTLFLALQHPNKSFRLLAVKRLGEIIQSGVSLSDLTFIAPVLNNLLVDSDVQISSAVLDISNLSEMIKPVELIESLVSVISAFKSLKSHSKSIMMALELCRKTPSLTTNALRQAMYGSLLYSCDIGNGPDAWSWVSKIMEFIGIPTPKLHTLKDIMNGKHENKNSQALNEIVLLFSSSIKTSTECNLVFLKKCLVCENVHARVFSSLVLNKVVIERQASADLIKSYLKVLKSQFMESASISEDFNADILNLGEGYSDGLYLKKVSLTSVAQFEKDLSLISFAVLILKTPVEKPVWYSKSVYCTNVMSMFEMVFLLSEHQSLMLKTLISSHISVNTIEFAMNCATNAALSSTIRCAAIDLASKSVEKTNDSLKDYQLMLPSLMMNLSCDDKGIRQKSMELIVTLKSRFEPLESKKSTPSTIYGYDTFYGKATTSVQYLSSKTASLLCKVLLTRKQEILADASYLSLNMNTMISSQKKMLNEVLSFLLSNLLAIQNKTNQVIMLNLLAGIDSPLKIKSCTKILESEVKSVAHETNDNLDLVFSLIKCYSVSSINSVLSKTECLSAFISLFTNFSKPLIPVSCYAIGLINDSFFSPLDLNIKQLLFSALIDALAFGSAEVKAAATPCLQSISISSEVIIPKLAEINQALEDTDQQKRAKSDENAQERKIAALIAFLEFLQFSSGISNSVKLVNGIVVLLNGLLDFPIANVEYPKQLILSSLENILTTAPKASELSEDVLRADLIVQCIRVTENPQTHNAALLCLAAMGKTHPDVVLMNVMPVFTFMGANVLRQDDNFSFHVVQQTLETIIPSLLKSQDESPLLYVKNIMDVFVGALEHIPSHRRLRLFSILAKTLGEDVYLGSLLSLIVTYPVIAAENQTMAAGENVNHKKFATHLLQQFNCESALCSLKNMMEIYSSLPDSKSIQEVPSVIDVSIISTKTVRLVKLHLLDFITSSLKINLQRFSSDESSQSHVELHRQLLQCNLRLITETQAKMNENSNQEKYLQRCLLGLYANLDAINKILSLPVFLEVVETLIKDEKDLVIKQRVIKILQDRVGSLKVDDSQIEQLENVTACLISSLRSSKKSPLGLQIKQDTLSCLATFVEKIGSKSLGRFTNVFSFIIGSAGLKSSNVEVCTSTLHAMTSFILVLGPRIIPFLAQFMAVVLEKLEVALRTNDENSKLIINGCLLVTDSLFEATPMFMSAYLGRLILVLCSTASVMIENETIAKLVSKLHTKIPAKVEHRVVFPAVLKQLDALVELGSQSLVTGLSFLQEVIQISKQSSLMEYANDWSKLFLSLFDSQFGDSLDVAIVEQGIISLFIKFTLKLNEKAFKPLYLKCVEWGLNDDDSSGTRKLFLFKLSDALLQNLKSIFVPYYGFVFDVATSVLEDAKSGSEIKPVWEPVLHSLGHCFAYDSSDFVTHERFEKVVTPLIDQLDLIDLHGPAYKDQMISLVIPTIGQLSVARRNEDSWKLINKSALMKTRSEHASVRWAALRVVSELYTRLGEEMLVFFPETIPFLAELLEDDDVEVEQLCKDVCLEIQGYLGEPIEPYFET